MNPALYYSLVFAQDDDAQQPLAILDREGEAAALAYLSQWDFGRESEHKPIPHPWGTRDHVFRSGNYTMTYNLRLGYIGLCRLAHPGP